MTPAGIEPATFHCATAVPFLVTSFLKMS